MGRRAAWRWSGLSVRSRCLGMRGSRSWALRWLCGGCLGQHIAEPSAGKVGGENAEGRRCVA